MTELSNLRYPDWEPQYKAAMLELDRNKLGERIQAAHLAISERLRVLSQDHFGSPEERNAIRDALSGLAVLERELAQSRRPEAV